MQQFLLSFTTLLTWAVMGSLFLLIPGVYAEVVFVPQAPFSTDLSGPRSVAAADLDGDGHTDLVVANETSNSVAVLRNNGTGTLALVGSPIPVGNRPVSILLANLGGNSRPDIVTAERNDDALTILLNTSSGSTISFSVSENSPVLTGSGPVHLTAGQFDGTLNTRRDLAVANLVDHSVSVFLQQVDGSFVEETVLQEGECCLFPNALARTDLNGDGASDLVIANVRRPNQPDGDGVHVWINSGTSTPFDPNQEPLIIELLDPEDGDPACDFGPPQPDEDCHTMSVAAAQLNADNFDDLVVANEFTGIVSVLFHNGNTANLAFTRADVSAGHNRPVFLTVADLDNDGDNDVIVVNRGSNDISVLFNHGNGAFAPPQNFPVGAGPVSVAVAHLNGDGLADLVVANRDANTLSILLSRRIYPLVSDTGDFNDDGVLDLATGSPGEEIDGHPEAGAVHILYGSASGLVTTGRQWLHQNSAGMPEVVENFDRFGSAIAVGDVNDDGFADLVIGVPGEDLGDIRDAGLVHILYGSASGLSTTNTQVFHLNRPGIPGSARAFDQFGSAVVLGRFNGDAYRDLAIGIPGRQVGTAASAGAVHILYGAASGLTSTNNQFWHQNSAGIGSVSRPFDRFGSSLAVGKFNGDAYRDLAIGIPGKQIGTAASAGAVHILYGAASGLSSTNNQFWHQNIAGIGSVARPFDRFGNALAVGNFNNDQFIDLAIGIPGKQIGTAASAGAVHILYGAASGLSSTNNQFWHQNIAGIGSVAQPFDHFGSDVKAGDFNGDAFVDLAIGVPGKRIEAQTDAGLVHILYGSAAGLATTNNQLFHQNRGGILNIVESFDRFGSALSVGDFNDDTFNDLVISVPGEDSTATAAGAVHVLDGSSNGPSSTGDQVLQFKNTGNVTVTGN